MSGPISPTCWGHRCRLWSTLSWIYIIYMILMSIHCSVFLLSSMICAIKIPSKPSKSLLQLYIGILYIGFEEETTGYSTRTGVGLTMYSQVQGGFRWSEFQWLWGSIGITARGWMWHCEICEGSNFHDSHQAIPFHSISESRLSCRKVLIMTKHM